MKIVANTRITGLKMGGAAACRDRNPETFACNWTDCAYAPVKRH